MVEKIGADETVSGKKEPITFNIKGNFPNPFNASTIIEYTIADRSLVELAVYSIAGQKIAVLENRMLDTGKYSMVWNAGNLASGTYFARLVTNKGIATHKMLYFK